MAVQEMGTQDPLEIEAELVTRARAMGPQLRATAAETEANRSVLKSNMRAVFDNQLVRFFQPKRHGGFELEWGAQFSIGRELAKYCPSTAWIVAVVGAHGCFLGRMPGAVQDEVWGPNQDQLIATASVNRHGGAKPEKDGLRVSGQWGFSSGCDHAEWAMFAVHVDGEAAPTQIVVPRTDWSIADTWHVAGMRGTGTKDLVLDDVFVPVSRTLPAGEWIAANPPGSKVNESYIYRVPFLPFVGMSLLGPLFGAAEGAYNDYCAITAERTGTMTGETVAENAPVQLRVAESAAELHAAEIIITEQIAYLRDAGKNGKTIPATKQLENNRDRAFVAKLCVQSTERLVGMMGAMGIFEGNPVQRHHRDIAAMATQIGVNWDRNMLSYGRLALGLPTGDSQVDQELGRAPS
jgi:3-hydroxy-9,10-secoandrosta-1,3,5(10)-triene-9,17-dione monooxygenase